MQLTSWCLNCCIQLGAHPLIPRLTGWVQVNGRDENLPADWDRDRVIEEINQKGIPCFSGSCSEIYKEKAFDGTSFRPKIDFPIAKKLGET